MVTSGGPDIVNDGLVLHLDAADRNCYQSGNSYVLNLAQDKYYDGEDLNIDTFNGISVNNYNTAGAYNSSTQTFSNSVTYSNAVVYPRFASNQTLTKGIIYEVYGRFSGDIGNVQTMNLSLLNNAYISYNKSTGILYGIQIQDTETGNFLISTDGRTTFSTTLEEFYIKKISAGLLRNSPTISNRFITFDGTNDYIDLGDILDDVIAGTDNKFSISLWAKFNSLSDDVSYELICKQGDGNFGENERQMVFLVRNSTAYNYGGYRVEFGTYGTLTSTVYRFYRTSDFSVETNKWYNLVATYDGSVDTNNGADRVNIYANGVLLSKTPSFTAGSLNSSIPSGAARLAIGAAIGKKISNSPLALFNGSMGNISIYNKALTGDEILQNYIATKGRYGL